MFLILYLILLSSIITECFSSKEIFPPLKKSGSKRYNVISNKFQDQIENIYIQKIVSEKINDDPICSLPKTKKIALCQQIFTLSTYKSIGIHISYTAFSIASSVCVKKPLRFETLQSTYPDDEISQNMYPCHARHSPIRTSFIEDSYYSKFYVSSGPDANSVIVYTYQYNAEDEWYNIHEYLQNILIPDTLPNKLINIREVTAELEENFEVTRFSSEELEYIYYREINFIPQSNDPVCSLKKEQKFALCKYIYNYTIYNVLNISINKTAFLYFNPNCVNKKLVFTHSRDKIYTQVMMNCYGRSQIPFGNILLNKYFDYFYISSGSRRNSIFVYIIGEHSTEPDGMNTVHLFEMIENLQFYDIISVNVQAKDAEIESKSTYNEIKMMMTYSLSIRALKTNLEEYIKNVKNYEKRHKGITKEMKDTIELTMEEIKETQALYDELNLDKKLESLFSEILNSEENITAFKNRLLKLGTDQL